MNNLIVSFLSGGATGYITNDLAIKMLFREYFGFGGVIEKEYKSFVENIAKLVEKDLINHTTLKEEIKSEKFKNVIKDITKSMIFVNLPYINGNKTLIEYKGYDNSKKNFEEFITRYQIEIIQELNTILQKHSIKDIISYSQFEIIFDSIFKTILSKEKEINLILFDILSTKTLSSFINNDTFYSLEKNLIQILKDTDFSIFDTEIENFLINIFEIINIDEIIKNLEKEINSFEIGEIFESKSLGEDLKKRIIKTLKNNPEILEKVIKEIIKNLEKIDVRVYDILDKKSIDRIDKFIANKLPIIISDLLRLIEKNKKEIEIRIDNAIDRVLDEDIGGKILKGIKNLIIGSISQKYNFVGKIEESLKENEKNIEEILIEKIENLLKTNTIGEIIKKAKLIEKSGLITRFILKNLDNLDISFIDDLGYKKIGEIYELRLEFIKKTMLENLGVFKENYLYTNKFKKDLNKLLSNIIENSKDKKIEELISEFNFSFASFNIEKEKIYTNFDFNIPKLNFEIKFPFEEIENKKFNDFYSKIQNEKVINNLSEFIIISIENNLQNLLKGNVSLAVEVSLSKLPPAQIRDMVENFMGKELKPITYLGALLGAGSGVGFSYLSMLNPSLKLFSPIIYGVTGVFTNYLAIKMLFKPYEKKWYLPFFSPGVVAKQKPKLAKNLASFVKDDILSDEKAIEMFNTNKEKLKELLIQKVSNKDYKLIDKILKENKEFLSDKAKEAISNTIQQNRLIIAEKIAQEISKQDFSAYKDIAVKKIYNYNPTQLIFNNIKNKTLNGLKVNFDEEIIYKIEETITFEKVRRKILENNDKFEKFSNKTLEEVLKNHKKEIIQKLASKLLEFIKNKEITINLYEKAASLFEEKKRISDVLDNDFITSNLDFIIKEIYTSLQELKGYVKEEAINSLSLGSGWILKTKVEKIVDEVFDVELYNFLNEKKYELEEVLEKILEYRIDEVGISLEKNSFIEIYENIISMPDFEKKFTNAVEDIIEAFLKNVTIKDMLRIANINSLSKLVDRFKDLIEILIETSLKNLYKNKEEFLKEANYIANFLIKEIFYDISIVELIEEELLKKDIENLIILLKADKNLKKELEYLVEEILENLEYDEDILIKDLSNFLEKIINEEEFRNFLKIYIEKIIINLNSILDKNLKDEILNEISDAIILSIEENIDKVIKSIDIKKVIEKEINEMNPKEIEEMFYSFAGSYFNKLILYGSIGAVFGIPTIFI